MYITDTLSFQRRAASISSIFEYVNVRAEITRARTPARPPIYVNAFRHRLWYDLHSGHKEAPRAISEPQYLQAVFCNAGSNSFASTGDTVAVSPTRATPE